MQMIKYCCMYIISRLSPAGTNTINVPVASLKATQWTLKQNPVPIVTPGLTKQLFFLNFAFVRKYKITVSRVEIKYENIL